MDVCVWELVIPAARRPCPGYVLRDFPKADEDWLDDLMRGIADGAVHLAEGDGGRFMNAVTLRTAPPRSSTSSAKEAPQPAQPKETDAKADERSPMQKLMDKFR